VIAVQTESVRCYRDWWIADAAVAAIDAVEQLHADGVQRIDSVSVKDLLRKEHYFGGSAAAHS
jgi:hypothetical protein